MHFYLGCGSCVNQYQSLRNKEAGGVGAGGLRKRSMRVFFFTHTILYTGALYHDLTRLNRRF